MKSRSKKISQNHFSRKYTHRVKLSQEISELKHSIVETENAINSKERKRLEEQIIRNEARNQQAELERLKIVSDEVEEWKSRQEDYEGTFRAFLDQNKSDWAETMVKSVMKIYCRVKI